MIELTESEITWILTRSEGLRCLADYWSEQETLFDGIGDIRATGEAQIRREKYQSMAESAEAIECGL